MKKIISPIAALLALTVIFTLCFSGCGNNKGELTYSGGYSEYNSNSDPAGVGVSADSQPTIGYHLTTKEGETVSPVSTTMNLSEFATGGEGLVDMPVMDTTYISGLESYTYSTTPDYTGAVISPSTQPSNPTTLAPITTQQTTETTTELSEPTTKETTTADPVKYIDISSGDTDCGGSLESGLYVDIDMSVFNITNTNSLTIKKKSGVATLTYGDAAGCCNVKYNVSDTPIDNASGKQIHITVTIPTKEAKKAIEEIGGFVYVTFDKGSIQVNDSKGKIYTNNSFTTAPNNIS